MRNILNKAKDKENINEYIERHHVDTQKQDEITNYLLSKKFLNDLNLIKNRQYSIKTPERITLIKSNNKTRFVYEYDINDNILASYLIYLLNKETPYLDCIYSFRQDISLFKAIKDIKIVGTIDNLEGYKIDLSDYDQNMNIDIAHNQINKYVKDEDMVYVLNMHINNSYYYEDGKLKDDAKGIKAGIAYTNFLQNIYLFDLDNYIFNNSYKYARYGDDLIFFDKNIEPLKTYALNYLNNLKLVINTNKSQYIDNKDFIYLNHQITDGKVHMHPEHKQDIIKTIKNKTNHFLKIKRELSLTDDIAMSMAIKYNNEFSKAFSFNFIYITYTDDIKDIDRLIQNSIRTIGTNRFNSKRYKIKISKLHELGYKSILNSYYNRTN